MERRAPDLEDYPLSAGNGMPPADHARRSERHSGDGVDILPVQVERARRTLWVGLLVLRWAFYAWMAIRVVTGTWPRYPALPWIALAIAGAWTLYLSLPAMNQQRPIVAWIDLALAVGLLDASAVVVEPDSLTSGVVPLFAVSYPSVAALLWGATRGIGGGIFAAAVLTIALAATRPITGVPLRELSDEDMLNFVNGSVYYFAAGAATGVFSRLFSRWAIEFRALADTAIRARERAARLGERDAMVRTIHDSVLHALVLIARRGRELGRQPQVPGDEVLRMAEMASEQEKTLRALILREPEEGPQGTASLRDQLEARARSVSGLPVTVTSVGPIWLGAREVEEVGAAVQQALDNVIEHAAATRANVFADIVDGDVIVSVRDDGGGFEYDEAELHSDGKAGILRSMKGRIESLGGTMQVDSAPGIGTEIEFRIPRGHG
jgi:signal transduction histidine kinase